MKTLPALLALLLLLTACGATRQAEEDGALLEDGASEESPGAAIPGAYTVPDGWVIAEQYSTDEVIFYVQEGHEEDELPDNISVSTGSNRYAAEDHQQFRDAVLAQLMRQLQGIDAQLLGDGTYTEQGYVVYIFTIEDHEEDVITKQYYIVDDLRYCLIHLTSFTGSEEADQAARAIADSFVWNESE